MVLQKNQCIVSECIKHGVYEYVFNQWYCDQHYTGIVCNYVGCTRIHNLSNIHSSYWCLEHLNVISEIRSKIKHKDSIEDAQHRLKELKIRKDKDSNHIRYYLKVLQKNWEVSTDS